MELYGSFEKKGYKIEAYWPTHSKESMEWIVKAYKSDKLVKEIHIPMLYKSTFGVDISDVATLEEKIDEMFNELP